MPKNAIFVDTSAICALTDDRDQYFRTANNFYLSLKPGTQLIISDFVLLESWFLISSHMSRQAALNFYNDAMSGVFDIIKIRNVDLVAASNIMKKYGDQDFSLVDSTSFNLMEFLGIDRVFTFDFHFRIYRKADGSAFEVLP